MTKFETFHEVAADNRPNVRLLRTAHGPVYNVQ